jgi:hypothetical protein
LHGVVASPITTSVVAQNFNGISGAIRALTLRPFVDGELPHVCERQLPVVAPIADLLPADGRVLHSYDDAGDWAWVVVGDEWQALIERSRHGDGAIEVFARSAELAEAIAADIADRCPAPANVDSVEVQIWHRSLHGATWHRSPVSATPWASSSSNYPTSSREPLDQLVRITPDLDAGRVILLHGLPGTGKTSFIRTLLWEWRAWTAPQVVLDAATFVRAPGYVAEVTTQSVAGDRWVLVVLEDAGHLVDHEHPFSGDLSHLLNISDGIVGMGTKALFVLTTNEPIRSVNPALIRAGRCLANIELTAFPRREAVRWLGEGDGVPAEGLTLAQLYERRGETPHITNLTTSEPHGIYL